MRITEQKFRDLLNKYLSNRASPEERAWLDEWYEKFKDDALEDTGTVPDGIRREILKGIESKMKLPAYRTAIYDRRRIVWLSAAASLILFITVSFSLFFSKRNQKIKEDASAMPVQIVERSTQKGQKLLVRLPDSTMVKLNSESILKFPERFDGETREVYLEGEAYFDVTHDPQMPFIVEAGSIKTTVLGTSFNVKSVTGSSTEVTLVRGKVNVLDAKGKGEPVILRPNQQAVVHSNSLGIMKLDVEVEKYIAWKNNTIYFDNTTLGAAVKILGSWYDAEIVLQDPSLGSCIINAKYQNESLENILQSLHYLLNLEHEIHGRKIILKGNGCKAGAMTTWI